MPPPAVATMLLTLLWNSRPLFEPPVEAEPSPMILIALAVGLAELMLIARPLMPLMPLKVTPAP